MGDLTPVTLTLRNKARAKRATGQEATPGWQKCTAYRQSGAGGRPFVRHLSKGLALRRQPISLQVIELSPIRPMTLISVNLPQPLPQAWA